MPRLCANIGFLFPEMPFLDRFEAAARAGFTAVEFASPYPDPAPANDDSRLPLLDYADPLSRFYRETAAITDTVPRRCRRMPRSSS